MYIYYSIPYSTGETYKKKIVDGRFMVTWCENSFLSIAKKATKMFNKREKRKVKNKKNIVEKKVFSIKPSAGQSDCIQNWRTYIHFYNK